MKIKTMKISLVVTLICLPGVAVSAANLPPLPMMAETLIAETWTCSFNEGKSISDVLKARDFMVAQAEKAGLNLPPSFLWKLFKGDTPVDYIWFNVHRDIHAFGAAADAWEASGIGPAVSDRFSSV